MRNQLILTSVLLFATVFAAKAQNDTIFYNADKEIVDSKTYAYTYSVYVQDSSQVNTVTEYTYFVTGKLKAKFPMLLKLKKNVKIEGQASAVLNWNDSLMRRLMTKSYDGCCKEWYESGKLHREMVYTNGKLNGRFISYWKNGQIRRRDSLVYGNSVGGYCFDENGKELTYTPLYQSPAFPGGQEAFTAFVSNNLKYPKQMCINGIGGRVVVTFVINTNGMVSDIKIKESLSDEADSEAMRIVSKMPTWKPGYFDGEVISAKYSIPINFRIMKDDQNKFPQF